MLSVTQTASELLRERRFYSSLSQVPFHLCIPLNRPWRLEERFKYSIHSPEEQYDISTEKKLTPYYLLEGYRLTTVQFDN